MTKKRGGEILEQNPDKVIHRPLEEVIHDSIMPYAEYVILERALPRVEDGLKPVQRRILYTMHELGLTPDKPHKKSARIVGDTLGKYHPHGDTSVYDAMVRMAQDFNMRYLLIDGHGNFGSMDGDSAAAMRYTEARLTQLSMELLRDIDKDTVPFSLNFDDTLKEPDVLPGRYPNLLVNGSTGIAVGLATNIPPHNLSEIIDGTIALMGSPEMSLEDLMGLITGPDFPTGGIIMGREEIVRAYDTGRGRIILRAKVDIEPLNGGKKQLVITELPYQVNKAVLLERILKLSEEKRGILTGISDIRDESDRTGIRAVIELRKDADADKILNYLYKYSDLQVTFGVNMVAIAGGRPQQMGLKSILQYYIRYQRDVVTKRTRYDLDKAKAREHILEGLMIAIRNIDQVIALIRSSKNPKEARDKLAAAFVLTEIQAQAILDMRLQKLTNLEILSLEKEYAQIKKLIAQLTAILNSEALLLKVIRNELLQIRNAYQDGRRTQIVEDAARAEIKQEDLILIEDIIITLSRNQEIKRIPVKSFNRSARDAEASEEKDILEYRLDSATNHRILIFTDLGNCYNVGGNDIPEAKWREKGTPLSVLLGGFEKNERVAALLSVPAFEESLFVQFYTRQGMVKRTPLAEYDVRKTKIAACGLKKEDRVLYAEIVRAPGDCLMVTAQGMSIRFSGSEISTQGRTASGVKGIKLRGGDHVIYARQIEDEGELVVLTNRGFAKRTPLADYEVQGRGGLGNRTMTFNKNQSNGREIIQAFAMKTPYDLLLLQKDGTVNRINPDHLPIDRRDARGRSVVLVLMDNEVVSAFRQGMADSDS